MTICPFFARGELSDPWRDLRRKVRILKLLAIVTLMVTFLKLLLVFGFPSPLTSRSH